jgi:predicted Mrr-cat superfamily restriction endonuclease
MTVCQISGNNAEDRVRAIVEGRPAPTSAGGEDAERLLPRDIEEVAHDQIITHTNQQFKDHELARLVGAVR